MKKSRFFVALLAIATSFFIAILTNNKVEAGTYGGQCFNTIVCYEGKSIQDLSGNWGAIGTPVNVANNQYSHGINTTKKALQDNEKMRFDLGLLDILIDDWSYIGPAKTISNSTFDVSYQYIPARDKGIISLTGARIDTGIVGHNIVRGENAIIFPDKSKSTQIYNSGYAYRYCVKEPKWYEVLFYPDGCKEWGNYSYQNVHETDMSSSTYSKGKLTYTDLENIRMVMPSFEINRSESESMSVSGNTVWNMKGKKPKWHNFNNSVYARQGGLLTWFWPKSEEIYSSEDNNLLYDKNCNKDFCTLANYEVESQVLMNMMVLKVTANVEFYAISTSDLSSKVTNNKARTTTAYKGTASSTVYYTFYVSSNTKDLTNYDLTTEEYFHMVNGWADELNGKGGSHNYLPINYDLSSVLDNTSYWSNIKLDTKNPVTVLVSSLKSSNKATTKISGTDYSVFTDLASVTDDGITIRAVGIDVRKFNGVVMDVSGKIYYKAPNPEIGGLTVSMTDAATSQTTQIKGGDATLSTLTHKSAKRITLKFTPDSGATFHVTQKTYTAYFNPSTESQIESTVAAQCFLNGYLDDRDIFEGYSCTNRDIKGTTNLARLNNPYTPKPGDNFLDKIANFDPNSVLNPMMVGYSYSKQNASKEYSLKLNASMNYSTIHIIRATVEVNNNGIVDAEDLSYYYIFMVDGCAPEKPTIDGIEEGSVTIIQSEDDINSFSYNSIEEMNGVLSYSYSLSGGILTVYATDPFGNKSNPAKYSIIIDSDAPGDVSGLLQYEDAEENSISEYLNTETKGGKFISEKIPLNGYSLGDSFEKIGTILNSPVNQYNSAINSFEEISKSVNALLPSNVENVAYLADALTSPKLTIEILDVGAEQTGIKGIYYKQWVGSTQPVEWSVLLNQGTGSFSTTVTLQEGVNYFAVIAVDNANKISGYDLGDGTTAPEIPIHLFVVNYFGVTNYLEDPVNIFEDSFSLNLKTTENLNINELIFIETPEKLPSISDIRDYIKVISEGSTSNKFFALSKIYKNVPLENNNVNKTEALKYSDIKTSETIKNLIKTFNNNRNAIENERALETLNYKELMLVRGLLLGKSTILVHIQVTTTGGKVDRYESIEFVNKTYTFGSTGELNLESTSGSTLSGSLIPITGNDGMSRWVDSDSMQLNYKFTLDTDEGSLLETYSLYFKTCYETEGSNGTTLYCSQDKRYKDGTKIIIDNMNENVVYHIIAGVMTSVVMNEANNSLMAVYNNEYSLGDYSHLSNDSLFGFISLKDGKNNNLLTSENYEDLYSEDDLYQYGFGKFAYLESVPEVTIEYVTINEYVEGGINKLKDHVYFEDRDNYIVKVTLYNKSDELRSDKREWIQLNKEDVKWYPYNPDGTSVCGNVVRENCGEYFPVDLVYWEEPDLSAMTKYEPLVYYLQFPDTESIRSYAAYRESLDTVTTLAVSAQTEKTIYSQDKFDLVVGVSDVNGITNNGMDLVVDEVVRKENASFLTIYYDQDAPSISVTSTPQKFEDYYSVMIKTNDVSSNVESISLYYGFLDYATPTNPNAQLLFTQTVNSQEFTGYTARLTQKGTYTVVSVDENGLTSYLSFEVVKKDGGVMYSPDLDDTDQITDGSLLEGALLGATSLAYGFATFLIIFIIALLIILIIIGLVKYNSWCVKNGKKPFWKKASDAEKEKKKKERDEKKKQEKKSKNENQLTHDKNGKVVKGKKSSKEQELTQDKNGKEVKAREEKKRKENEKKSIVEIEPENYDYDDDDFDGDNEFDENNFDGYDGYDGFDDDDDDFDDDDFTGGVY